MKYLKRKIVYFSCLWSSKSYDVFLKWNSSSEKQIIFLYYCISVHSFSTRPKRKNDWYWKLESSSLEHINQTNISFNIVLSIFLWFSLFHLFCLPHLQHTYSHTTRELWLMLYSQLTVWSKAEQKIHTNSNNNSSMPKWKKKKNPIRNNE